MRITFPPVSATTLAAAVLCAAAAVVVIRPAAAQQGAASGLARPVFASAARSSRVVPRTVARYHFAPRRATGAHVAGIPELVTVADSAGQLVASFRLRGDRVSYPMLVTLIGSDLVLQGATPAGVLTLRLDRQSEPEALSRNLSGRWYLGGDEGRLSGHLVR